MMNKEIRDMNGSYWQNKNILIIGASSDLCTHLLPQIMCMSKVGLHYNSNVAPLEAYAVRKNVKLFQQKFSIGESADSIVDAFVSWSGGIDYLIIMVGNCLHPVYWESLQAEELMEDYYINTVVPFLLAKHAVGYMKEKGGRIIFTGTASAQNAGGSNSLSYGAAKLGLECIMKRMAKDCAKDNILVNMVNPGFIKTKFQTQTMKRSEQEILKRAEFVPLKRSGTLEEVAAPYIYLLSEHTSFVTGEVLNVKGGDWI